MKETESLPIAAQDNAIRTNHIKARIDKTQQNSKCRLCGDRDETINHIISECSQLSQKEYKARHDWVGKVVHWEMCRKYQFDHTNKWYMHNPAPVLKKDSHKLLWDFNIQTDHLIPARRPDLILINKRKRICKIVDFAVPADHRSGGIGSWRTGRDYPNDSIAEDGQNTETSPGDLRRLVVSQTPVKNHQLTLMWKTLEE